jgi:chorismate mutase
MKEIPMLCDVSHISGNPDLIPQMAQKAMDLDMDGIMMEVHRNPKDALSDAQQQVTPLHAYEIINGLIIRSTNTSIEEEKTLQSLRARVDTVDDELLQALMNRMQLIEQIGAYKKTNGLTIFQLNRWEEILKRQKTHAAQMGLSTIFIEKLYELIHAESIRIQTKLFESNDLKELGN